MESVYFRTVPATDPIGAKLTPSVDLCTVKPVTPRELSVQVRLTEVVLMAVAARFAGAAGALGMDSNSAPAQSAWS